MILYYLRPDGAFIVGDTKLDVTAYAYPNSPHAVEARARPAIVAERMIVSEVDRVNLPAARRAIAMLQDAERMHELDVHGTDTANRSRPSPRAFIPPATYREREKKV